MVVEEVGMTHLLPAFFLPFFGFGFVMYFLPSIVAFARSKRDTAAIVLLNFFLGWTVIGWVVALVWAVKTDVPMVVR
jgi:Superinfection immunity protein